MSQKILIIEDDDALGRLMHRRLTAAGFECLWVPDAVLGIQESIKEKPDLVVLDLMLPAGGGQAVLRSLRNSVYCAATPVLIVTGMEREMNEYTFREIEELGVDGYLNKPFEGKDLVDKVNAILSGAEDGDGPLGDAS